MLHSITEGVSQKQYTFLSLFADMAEYCVPITQHSYVAHNMFK